MQLKPTPDARVEVFVGEGVFPCALTIGPLQSLEKACDAGPWVLMDRLRSLTCRTTDIRETIRWGLIGAGMSDRETTKLLDTYVVPGRLMEYVPVAITILYAALYGPEDDPIEGEPQAPTNETPTHEDSLSGQPSTSSPEQPGDQSKK